MTIRHGIAGLFLSIALLLSGCGGAGESDNETIAGKYKFRSISIQNNSTPCPGSVTVNEQTYTCGFDTIDFDEGGTFTAFRNGSASSGSYTYYDTGTIAISGGGNSQTGNADLDGDTLTIRLNFGENEVWVLERTD